MDSMDSMDSNIRGIWRRIETVVRRSVPDAATMLNSPAWDLDVEEVEAALGLKLPEDFRESLQVHDGQNDPQHRLDIFGGVFLFGSGEIVKSSRMLSNLYEWNRHWIPFAARLRGKPAPELTGTPMPPSELKPLSALRGQVVVLRG